MAGVQGTTATAGTHYGYHASDKATAEGSIATLMTAGAVSTNEKTIAARLAPLRAAMAPSATRQLTKVLLVMVRLSLI